MYLQLSLNLPQWAFLVLGSSYLRKLEADPVKFKKNRKYTLLSTLVLFVGIFACTKVVGSKPHYVKKDPPSQNAAANIFGTVVTEDALERNMRVFKKRLEVYETKRRAIDEMVRKMAFEAMAKSKKMSMEAFLKSESEKATKKISKKAVDNFLKGRVQDASGVPEKVREQVKGILHLQNLVARYTKKRPVELYLKRPRAKAINFDLANAPVWGNKNAPVTIVEFSDFQCPYCRLANENIVQKLKKRYGKRKIRVVFKHFPLRSIHPLAQRASEASMCVHEQNAGKFWKYQDILFENQRKLEDENLKTYAKKVGMNLKKFEECLKSEKYKSVVDAHFEEGEKLGVSSTPTFFVNSQPVGASRTLDPFKEVIDEEIRMAKKK